MSLRVCTLLLLWSVSTVAKAQAQDYLDESILALPTNGTNVRTPRPLAPYDVYRIKVSSPYDLRPAYSENQGVSENFILVDGKTFNPIAFTQENDGHLGNIEFLYRGLGKPISIGLQRDFHKEVETAVVEIHVETLLEKIWRQQFSRVWQEHGDLIAAGLMVLPAIAAIGWYLTRRNRRTRAEERRAEKERLALVMNSHNKSLEVMREIDRRAQQKAQEVVLKNYDELQRKVMYWRTRAYTESYFLNPELRHNFAIANRDRIISELEAKWAHEFLEIAQDLPLTKALREQEPGVMHWIQARQEVVNLAHNMAWAAHPVIEAYFEEVSSTTPIIIVDEFEEAEQGRSTQVQ